MDKRLHVKGNITEEKSRNAAPTDTAAVPTSGSRWKH